MVIPITGLVFLFGSFVFLYLSRKFYSCYKEENNQIARYFSYGFFSIGLSYLIEVIPCLLLIEDHFVWRIVAPLYIFLYTAGWTLFAYTVFSNKFPKYSKIISFLLFFVLITTVSSYLSQVPNYYYTDGSLNWEPLFGSNLQRFSLVLSNLATFLLLIPLIIIFFSEAKKMNDIKIKIRSLGFAVALIFLFISIITDLVFVTILKVHPGYSDLVYLLMFSALASTLIYSWFPPKPKLVKKIE